MKIGYIDPLLETSCMDHPFFRRDIAMLTLNHKLEKDLDELHRLELIRLKKDYKPNKFWLNCYLFIKHEIFILINLIRFILNKPIIEPKRNLPPHIDYFI